MASAAPPVTESGSASGLVIQSVNAKITIHDNGAIDNDADGSDGVIAILPEVKAGSATIEFSVVSIDGAVSKDVDQGSISCDFSHKCLVYVARNGGVQEEKEIVRLRIVLDGAAVRALSHQNAPDKGTVSSARLQIMKQAVADPAVPPRSNGMSLQEYFPADFVASVAEKDLNALQSTILKSRGTGSNDNAKRAQRMLNTGSSDGLDDACRISALVEAWTEFGVFEIPLSDAGHTVIIDSGKTMSGDNDAAVPEQGMVVWVRNARYRDRSSAANNAPEVGVRWTDVNKNYVTVPVALATVAKEFLIPAPKINELSSPIARVCSAKLTLPAHASFESFAMPAASQGLATLADGTSYTIDACDGDGSCAGSGSKKIGSVTVRTPLPWGLDLLAGVHYDFRLAGVNAPLFTQYAWTPTSTSTGQQLYELRAVPHGLQSVGLSLDIAVRLAECDLTMSPHSTWCWVKRHMRLGLGTTLTTADGSSSFKQWTLGAFIAPTQWWDRNKMYLMIAAGIRISDGLLVGRLGDEVQAMTAPTPTTYETVTPVVSIGVAFDLSVVGDAASSLFGTSKASSAGKN